MRAENIIHNYTLIVLINVCNSQYRWCGVIRSVLFIHLHKHATVGWQE